jgi:hypothetical protein
LIPLVGMLLEGLHERMVLTGYRGMGESLLSLKKALRGRIRRDGDDLVLSGSMGRRSVVVRFSHSENSPELSLKVHAQAEFTLYCLPHKYPAQLGRATLRTTDPAFDSTFRVATDHPRQAAFLLSYSDVAKQIRKLCYSSQTLLALRDGSLEFSEMTFPAGEVYQHVLDQTRLMVKIADAAAKTAGVKLAPVERQPRNWFRIAYVCASVLLLSATLVARSRRDGQKSNGVVAIAPKATDSSELSRIPDSNGWRLVQKSDFDPSARNWMQDEDHPVEGTVSFDVTPKRETGVAYLLKPKGANSPTRLVITVNGNVKFDVKFPEVAMIALVRHDSMDHIVWGRRPPQARPEGDGVLVIWRLNEPQSSTLFFANGWRVYSADPKDYHDVALN